MLCIKFYLFKVLEENKMSFIYINIWDSIVNEIYDFKYFSYSSYKFVLVKINDVFFN